MSDQLTGMVEAFIETLVSAPVPDYTMIDYVRGLPVRLHSEVILDRGVVTQIRYWLNAEVDPATRTVSYSKLVVQEDHNYTRDALGFALARHVVIRWTDEDGALIESSAKIRPKVYNAISSLKEGETRRRNVIDGLKPKLLGMLQGYAQLEVTASFVAAQVFFTNHQGDINAYLESGGGSLAAKINSDEGHSWLNSPLPNGSTIRDVLLYEIS